MSKKTGNRDRENAKAKIRGFVDKYASFNACRLEIDWKISWGRL